MTAVLVAGAALAVVLTSQSDDKKDTTGSGGGEVFLQNTSASGPDPFTQSTARTGGGSASPASLPPRTASAETGTPQVSGSTPGLYGGTQSVASCNVEQQVRFLSAEPTKNAAFASVLGIKADQVPGYLRSLTPLQLRADTRVTNHGFRSGSATTYQAVLQTGTAVLVDGRGVPRVRCACGNPLTDPVAQKAPQTTGTPWQAYNSSQVVVVAPSVTVVNVFVVYDPENDGWFARKHGDTGRHDKPTPPPPPPPTHSKTPSVSPSTSISTSPSISPLSPVPCVTVTGTETPTPSGGVTPSPCPSTLSPTPSTSPPSSPPTSPSDSTSPPDESPSTDTSPPDESPGPESGPAPDGSAGLDASQSAASPPQSPSSSAAQSLARSPSVSGTASVSPSLPAPGPKAAPIL
ncbi:DUF6777 domain-containing protein [Streptomyces sp. NBC_00094]|uniref:DUF6777 domain-containing protein n=1 Tax=Streptomyces sp. NBC_00094 TaxID=2903620 RepID=UPI00225876C3|nr:DUF6777 domain-containing protein [Streptomyces sp. NBC_00094]MCX5388787.1 hypothetical protein [Streptomyces sp. NBC_00094]